MQITLNQDINYPYVSDLKKGDIIEVIDTGFYYKSKVGHLIGKTQAQVINPNFTQVVKFFSESITLNPTLSSWQQEFIIKEFKKSIGLNSD